MVGNSCNIGCRFAAQIVIARCLGLDDFGRVAYMIWLIEITSILMDAGLKISLTRFIAELNSQGLHEQAAALARRLYYRYVILAVLGTLITTHLFLKSSVSAGFEHTLPFLMLLFLSRSLAAMFTAYLRGEQRFQLLAWVNIFSSICMIAALGAGAYFFGVVGVLCGYAAGPTIPAILLTVFVLRGHRDSVVLERELNSRLWRFALNSWFIALLGAFVWSRTEIFFVERYWNLAEVAMFAVSVTLSGLASMGPLMLTGAFLPHFTELANGKSRAAVMTSYATCTRLLAFLLFPVSFGGAAVIPVLLPMLYGSDFARAVPTAIVLLLTASFTFAGVGNSLLYALERPGYKVFDGCLGAILLILGLLLIVPMWGAFGAACCRATVQLLLIILNLCYLRLWIGCPVPVWALLRTLLAALSCGLFASIVLLIWPVPLALGIAIPVGTAAYLGACRRLHILEAQDVMHIDAFLAYMRVPFRPLVCQVLSPRKPKISL